MKHRITVLQVVPLPGSVAATVAHPSGQEAYVQLTDGSVHKVTGPEGDLRTHFKSKLPKSCLKMEAVSASDVEGSPAHQALFLCSESLPFDSRTLPSHHKQNTGDSQFSPK